ncbi:RUS1 family protein-like [Pseudocercospora fuligena]|uniref:RUS1 family protein-like n=1 Tax=Pseudocercospora fuligena TaxID=685502 RepID=A0A8H6RE45_9PEZI|nr:RUS1 family protein-like [Pseudocercospora fuligena]
MAVQSLRITEYDEADTVTATYVQSEGKSQGLSRVDVIPRQDLKSLSQTAWNRAVDVFLPVGYPHSVSEDYLEYQIYDSLQAFSSSIASLLSSRAVLSSVGVGDSTASPTAAIILSILQDSVGRIATILFAHRFGTSLEPECKMYRLLADVLNDTGFVLDCMSPVFPKPIRVVVLSFSSVLRSLCGVAAGSSKASLSAHFAKQGNLGELNAKDSSQETVISLVGMMAGSLVISWITTPIATWTALIVLLSIHLETNRRAVRAVKMRTLTRQRATLVYHQLQQNKTPTPDFVANQERIFERDGVLRNAKAEVLGFCAVGVPLARLLNSIGEQHSQTRSSSLASNKFTQILDLYQSSAFILWSDKSSRSKRSSLFIVVKKNAVARDLILAWWQAVIFAELASSEPSPDEKADGFDQLLKRFSRSLNSAKDLLEKHKSKLKAAGWNLELGAIQTMAATTVTIEHAET